jgi:hypothetical protein
MIAERTKTNEDSIVKSQAFRQSRFVIDENGFHGMGTLAGIGWRVPSEKQDI